MKPFFLLLSSVFLSGCIMGGARKAYLAEWRGAPPPREEGAVAASRGVVRVGPVAAAEPYASTRMLVWEEKTGRLRGTKGSQLAVPPAVCVQAAVVRALEKSGAFDAVVDGAIVSGGGVALRGAVEKARLEKTADGRVSYALRATFAWTDPAGGERRFAVCEDSVPAASESPQDQVRAASEAAGAVATDLLSRFLAQ